MIVLLALFFACSTDMGDSSSDRVESIEYPGSYRWSDDPRSDTMGYPGKTAGPDTDSKRYRYEGSCQFEYDVSVVSGAWMTETVAGGPLPAANSTGTPPYVTSNSNTDAWTGMRPFPDDCVNLTDAPGSIRTIDQIEVWYLRGAAADKVTVTLYRALRDGSGAGAAVVSYSDAEFATADGAFHKYTGTPGHAMDPLYFYFFRATINPDAAAANAALGPMFVRVSRDVVE